MEKEKHNLMRTAMLLLLMILTASTAWADHKIVVIADPHVMGNGLQDGGTAWQTYLAGSRKLIDYSQALFDQAVTDISGMTEMPELVLIVGDLTKDGEQASHNYVQTKFAALKAAGIQPLVIPGNHDLGTTEAKVYNGDETSDATTIAGADAFATQYADYGYGLTSTERESTTLTYACEPISGLVVIGIDSGTDGVLSETTLRWVCGKAIVARAAGKQVIAMMHHPLIPHITGGNMFVETVSVSNYANVRNRLTNAGITTIFTGHFHTSDIAKDWNADKTKTIYDVTTGSLCSYPCDYRVVTLNNDFTEMSIETETATSDATITAAAAKERLTNSMTTILAAKLTLAGYGELASTVAPLLANAYVFHAEGNENLSGNAQTYLNTIISILDDKLASQEINSVQYFALSALVTSMLQDKSNYGTDRVNQTNDRELIVSTTPGLTIDGDGTASAPYQISSYAQLKLFAEIVNLGYTDAYAILMGDIVCKNGLFDSDYATDWTPIGNSSNKYTGTFDGDGYTITGLSTPTSNSSDYVGLFGYVGSGGVVQNVKLEDANITGNSHVGGIVGRNCGVTENSVVSNSSITGQAYVGSIVGYNDGTIQNCAFIGTSIVRGSNDYTGGIAGYNSGTVKNSYVALSGSGSISATGNNAGGIVGYNGSTIESCHYSGSGAISSVDNVGGVVGTNFNQGKVRCCYYAGTGEITATAISNFIGAIIGKNNGTTEYCYYNKNNTDVTNAIGIVFDTEKVKGLTAAQFKDENFLTTYNFSDQIWLQGVVAPLLKGMPYTVSFKANGGTGSMDDQTVTVTSDDDNVLRSNTFTRDNYHFTGWNTKADGTGVDVATNVQAKLVGPETLYAQWCANTNLEAHYASEATCTEAGNTAYWSCSACGKYFSDEEGETEIAENSWVIDALGHNVVNSVCTRCNGVTTLYIDADGTEKNEVAVPLDNTMNNLAAGWYVVNSDIDYASTLTFTGDAHLILCDGATLTVKNIEAATNLNIYAQSGNSGKLTVNAAVDDTYGIYSYNEVNINGGTVSIENAQYGINTYDINISGAKVFIDNTEQGIHTRINDSSVKIDNATVEITAAIGDEPCAIYVCDNLTINNSIVKASAASTKDGTNFAAISAGSIDISGGKSYVEATASSPNPSVLNCGIYAYLINITDATVSASAESTAANTDKGIGIYSNGDITINSGKVTANGDYIGMSADNHNITLGYNNFGDYIYASSYSGIVNIKDGKAFTYDNGAGSATPYNVSAIDIAGKYLFPVVNEITLKANSDGANNYWATFYCGHTSFTADGNTTIYKGAVNGNSVRLTSVEDIPAGNAVVLKSSKPTITLTAATTTTTSNTDFTDNDLKGTDIDIVPPANTYCLTNGGNGVGFYQFSATYGNIPANRAYLIIAGGGGNGAPAYSFLGFDEDDATSLSEELRVKNL